MTSEAFSYFKPTAQRLSVACTMQRASSILVKGVRASLNNGSPFSLQFNRGMAGRILYTAETTATGGRNGTAKSTDGTGEMLPQPVLVLFH